MIKNGLAQISYGDFIKKENLDGSIASKYEGKKTCWDLALCPIKTVPYLARDLQIDNRTRPDHFPTIRSNRKIQWLK